MRFFSKCYSIFNGFSGRIALDREKVLILAMKTAAMLENKVANSLEKPFATRF